MILSVSVITIPVSFVKIPSSDSKYEAAETAKQHNTQ